jgi:folate-binding protein YgfZ
MSGTFFTECPRDVVQVVGPDAATYLQSQVSNDLRSLEVGGSRWAFLLQPTGRVDVLVRVTRLGVDEFVVDTDEGFLDTMVARLNRFRIRVKAEVVPVSWRCIAVRGADLDVPAGAVVAWGNGYDLLGEMPVAPIGVRSGSSDELTARRVDAVWPAMGAEIEPGVTIPAETGIVQHAVNFTKGCYPGQELVERMDSRGASAPRLLTKLRVAEHLDASFTTVAGEWGLAYVGRAERSAAD